MKPISRLLSIALTSLAVCGCAANSSSRRASSLEFLYPQGAEAQPATDVTLHLPLRVGIAFAPSANRYDSQEFSEDEKRNLLERVAGTFRGRTGIARVEVIPSIDLQPGGGFVNLERIAQMYGLDTIALVSYEQVQFDEATTASITYWTIVGAYVVAGNRNETHTMLDAAVFDVPSHALLFRSSGTSTVARTATAINANRSMREGGNAGFEEATTSLISNTERALAEFKEQAKSGTVRGPGTPAIAITASGGGGGGAGGAGAAGFGELAAAIAMACGAILSSRRRVA